MRAAVIYYTCNTHRDDIEQVCRAQLDHARGEHELVTVSRDKAIPFGDERRIVNRPRSPETMHYQILEGLRATDADYVFLCESDVLYHPSHFNFEPGRRAAYWYNTNVWKVWADSGIARWTDNLQQVSACCANRELLLRHYERRIERIETEGRFSVRWGFEPGSHLPPRGFDDIPRKSWMSPAPNICIRHEQTLTYSKQSPEEFRNQKYAQGWTERDDVPHWGRTRDRFNDFLTELLQSLSEET